MNTQAISQTLFAAWLAENEPTLFNALAQRAGVVKAAAQPLQLSGFTDILTSIGSGISTAAKSLASSLSGTIKSVGSFLGSTAGQGTLTSLATLYASSQLSAPQAAVLQTQADRAAAGLAPAPIAMQWDPATQSYVPVNPMTGQAYATSQLQSFAPFLNRYGIWIVGGGLALVLMFSLMRRGR